MRSYETNNPTKPRKPPVAATPAAELVPVVKCTGGGGGEADAIFGTVVVKTNALAIAARTNVFI